MRTRLSPHQGLGLALAFAVAPFVFAPSGGTQPPAAKLEYFKGKVVPLAGLLEKIGSKLDAEAAPHWLALVTDDGKVYPLIKDENSRPFFKDPRLLDRPMRVGGRRFQDTNLLQVLSLNSYVKGELHEVYYWCDICAIRRSEKMAVCECCGGPMELKEVPMKK